MKVNSVQSFSVFIEYQSQNHRRCDFICPITFQLPESLQGGDLSDIIGVSQYNGTETIELSNVVVTRDNPEVVFWEGNTYRVVSTAGKRKRGLFRYIKAARDLDT